MKRKIGVKNNQRKRIQIVEGTGLRVTRWQILEGLHSGNMCPLPKGFSAPM